MPAFILLSSDDAARVRGPSTSVPFASLEPVERRGGLFILGVDVLADPAHEAHKDYLGALLQMDSADPGFPAEIEETS